MNRSDQLRAEREEHLQELADIRSSLLLRINLEFLYRDEIIDEETYEEQLSYLREPSDDPEYDYHEQSVSRADTELLDLACFKALAELCVRKGLPVGKPCRIAAKIGGLVGWRKLPRYTMYGAE